MIYVVKTRQSSDEAQILVKTEDQEEARAKAAEEIRKLCDAEADLKTATFWTELYEDGSAEAPSSIEEIFTAGIVRKEHFDWLAWAAIHGAVPYAVDSLGRWFELFGPVLRWNEAYNIDGVHGLKPFFSSDYCDWVFEGYELCEL